MDKEKEDPSTSKITTPTTPSTADDESITTTSTDSDAFETWTLVTDKNKTKKGKEAKGADDEDRIEILKSQKNGSEDSAEEEEEEEEKIEPKPEPNSSMEDLSDGISIISESESSGGRISPHPLLREHLDAFDLKLSQGDEIDAILRRSQFDPSEKSAAVSLTDESSPSQMRQRRKKRSSPVSADKRVLHTVPVQSVVPKPQIEVIARRCLAGAFYVGVALAMLAFIAKLRNPEWKTLSNEKSSSDLEQKLVDIELQNNLMRAEIDILSKQVNYLSDLKDKGSIDENKKTASMPNQREAMKERKNTFKAWPGNGDAIDPVHINKEQLKKPYKCPDGKFVEIAGMCVENTQEEPIIDKIGNIVNYILHQSESVKTAERILEPEAEPIDSSSDPNPNAFPKTTTFENERDAKIEEFNKQKQRWKENKQQNKEERYQKEHKHSAERFGGSSKENFNPQNGKYERKRHAQQHKRQNKKHFNDSGDDESDENGNGNEEENNSKEKHKKRGNKKNHSKERTERQASGESKERIGKQRRKHSESEERFDKKRNYRDNSAERFQKDGQWHEKMMQHREEARREQEQQFEKNRNWFTERGSSRERMRFGENNYR